jgi:DNA-binding response OmpR family regulator
MEFETLYKQTSQLKILFIEDNLSFQEETKELFEHLFYSVDLANNGEDGINKYLDFFQKNKSYYDLVISDICMPKLNGIELTKQIYSHNPQQVIIILSAHTDSSYLLEFVNLGVEQFLLKPIDHTKMLDVFYNSAKKILSQSQLSDQNQGTIHLNQEFTWDKKTSNLLHHNKPIKLTKKEQFLMEMFIKNHMKITPIDEILYKLWEDTIDPPSKENIKPIISRLRKKIPSLEIESIYNLGYRLLF